MIQLNIIVELEFSSPQTSRTWITWDKFDKLKFSSTQSELTSNLTWFESNPNVFHEVLFFFFFLLVNFNFVWSLILFSYSGATNLLEFWICPNKYWSAYYGNIFLAERVRLRMNIQYRFVVFIHLTLLRSCFC